MPRWRSIALCHILRIGKSSGRVPDQRPDAGIAPILPRLDRQDVDLQDIARLGALDRDRPGQDMRAEPRRQRLVDRAMVGEDFEGRVGRQVGRPPDTQSSVTVSPDATVTTGGSAESKNPQWQCSGRHATV